MKRLFLSGIISILLISTFCGCMMNTGAGIEEGKYVCDSPYMTITVNYDNPYTKDYIEIDNEIYETFTFIGYTGDLSVNKYEEKYASSPDMPYYDSPELNIVNLDYKYDKRKKEFKISECGSSYIIYTLKKVE